MNIRIFFFVAFTISSTNSFSQLVNIADLIGEWKGSDSLYHDKNHIYKFIDSINVNLIMKVEKKIDTFELKYTLDTLKDMSILHLYNPIINNLNVGNFYMKKQSSKNLKWQLKKKNNGAQWDYTEYTRTFILIKQD